jgi:hypothetical protein
MKIVITLFISALVNFVLFVPSSPVNLLLYLFIKENRTSFLLIDLALSNLIFLSIYGLLKKISSEKTAT